MNNFFINKVKLLRRNLPRNAGDPLALVKRLMSNRRCNFSFKCVHPDEIDKIIDNLKNSKSCGSDNIDTYIIKLAKEELVPCDQLVHHPAALSRYLEDIKDDSSSQEG